MSNKTLRGERTMTGEESRLVGQLEEARLALEEATLKLLDARWQLLGLVEPDVKDALDLELGKLIDDVVVSRNIAYTFEVSLRKSYENRV
jgi:hypothetical protein